MKKKKIIIFSNVIMVSILALIYFLFIKNKTYTTYTKNYDEYMCWIINLENSNLDISNLKMTLAIGNRLI